MHEAIYQIEACWYIMGTESCHILSMLAMGEDAEDAMRNLRSYLADNCVELKVDVSKPIKSFGIKHLGYFNHPVIVPKRPV